MESSFTLSVAEKLRLCFWTKVQIRDLREIGTWQSINSYCSSSLNPSRLTKGESVPHTNTCPFTPNAYLQRHYHSKTQTPNRCLRSGKSEATTRDPVRPCLPGSYPRARGLHVEKSTQQHTPGEQHRCLRRATHRTQGASFRAACSAKKFPCI